MPLTMGARVGPYEITAQIGAGGMGEVYRARDTKLNRDVALKILPELFASDADRLARFTREAQTLASLNHPNIAAIYGIEDSGDTRALVMELIEGEDLSQRIARGRLPLDEALPIANQIADALAAAHGQGVIHRDLKPANVKVRPDGTVKVLDFGLAKALESSSASPSGERPGPMTTASPTITTPAMTMTGAILGTAAYMSPEQARGRTVDKRADIWALGCVLYEMLSGRRAFDAEDVSMTLASVMMKEPDWTALPGDTPENIRTVVKRCLEKDRQQRLSDIAVAQFLINEPSAAPAVHAAPLATIAARQSIRVTISRFIAVGAVSALALAAAVGTTWWFMRPAAPQPVRFTIVPPASQPLTIQGFQRDIAITPDGRYIVYRTGPAGTTGTQLAVRALDQLDARILTGISGVRSPFLSPDGRWIGFFAGATDARAGGELKKVSILGGPPVTLCKFTLNPYEASWGPDDTIIFATGDRSSGLLSVGAGGGDPKVLTKPDTAHGEADHVMPFILPGGRAVLFTITGSGSQPRTDNTQIAVLDLKTGEKKTLIRGGSDARYVETGHLVYASAGALRAVRFDLGRLEVTSDPVPVLENVTMSGTTGTADFVLSQNGTLVYVPGGITGASIGRTLAWVDRQRGEEVINAAPPRSYANLRISPDGTRVALDIRDQENDIWVWDLKRETLTRLTFDAAQDQAPVWTPDSGRIIFSSGRTGQGNLYWQAADNTGTIEQLTTAPIGQSPSSISPDGMRVLFTEVAPKTGLDIGMLRLASSASQPVGRPAQPPPPGAPPSPDAARKNEVGLLRQTPFDEQNAEISPDGRWVAYQSNESGSNQVYVRPFPNVDAGQWQISTGAGTKPVWARNGRELFYEANGALMAVTTQTTGTSFSYGSPTKLFDANTYFSSPTGRTYDVSADGRRFLMIKLASQSGLNPPVAAPSLIVVEHWTEELKAQVPSR